MATTVMAINLIARADLADGVQRYIRTAKLRWPGRGNRGVAMGSAHSPVALSKRSVP